MAKVMKEAIDITICVLSEMRELHYKACFEDVSSRPIKELDCICPLKDTIEQLRKAKDNEK